MRTAHLLDRSLDATPVAGLVVITLLIAFGGLLDSLPFGLVPDLSKPEGDSDFYFVQADNPETAVLA